ncbi:class I SAM-dependent methyltransferase [Natronosalvus halobius]|uniref:class I SAM-dependent methyltransferase n=1 Tax=Natronosalvus halobius TaxID=2953746 RepID=UPI00209F0508|nr:class I SAM-dependent methyltransferase [Natronosalvus halobius]USZ72484.1 class I SAM-dependent methyltransferase [Natronosalvus halobius]
MTTEPPPPEERAMRVWSLGSYPDIAPHFLSMAAHLVESTAVTEGETVLDVACGTGNVALTAARRGATVTGLDLVPTMLEVARENATIADVDVEWHEGTATDLPFDDDTFDVTLSCVGHMFAEPPDDAARELLRVTRSSGTVGFTSWTPSSVVPAMGAVVREYLPPNPNAPDPPSLWGDSAVVRDRIGSGVDEITFETASVLIPALSPEHYWESATTESGLFIVALEPIDQADRPALRDETVETIGRYFDDHRNCVPMEYLLTKATVA